MKEQKNDKKVGKKFAIAKKNVLVKYKKKKKKKDVNSKEDVLQEKKIRQCSIIIIKRPIHLRGKSICRFRL